MDFASIAFWRFCENFIWEKTLRANELLHSTVALQGYITEHFSVERQISVDSGTSMKKRNLLQS